MQWFVHSMQQPNAEMVAAAKAEAAGDLDGAIAALERPSDDDAIYQEFELEFNPGTKHLMLGDLYECKRRWKDAFTAWSFAAEKPLPDAKADAPCRTTFRHRDDLLLPRAHPGEHLADRPARADHVAAERCHRRGGHSPG